MPAPQRSLYNIDHFFPSRHVTIWERYSGEDAWQYEGKSVPMPKRLAKKPDRNCPVGHSISQSKEPLPPYELDPMFDNQVVRNDL
jgi:hypothetical protein